MDMYHPTWFAYIALQAGIPTYIEGMPGCAKTAANTSFASAIGRRYVPLIGSQCSPEDAGGLPVPDHVKFLCRLMPMSWVSELLTPGGFLALDEFPNTPPSVHASLLTIIQDKRVGDVHLDIDTLILAMGNPIEVCPNGTPFSLPTANRFFHAKWQNDRAAWLRGLTTCEWEAPKIPVVPSDWKSLVPKWGGLMATFHTRFSEMANVPPKDETTMAYPTERTWRNTVMCCAAAEAAGADMYTDQTNVRLMVAGNVGEMAADMFCQFKGSFDLADPVEVADGRVQFKHRDERPDVTLAMLAALATTVSTASTFTPDRWDRVAGIFGEIGTSSHPEMALRYTRILIDATTTFKHAPNAKVLKPLMELNKAMRA
jgi:hypothetical protein